MLKHSEKSDTCRQQIRVLGCNVLQFCKNIKKKNKKILTQVSQNIKMKVMTYYIFIRNIKVTIMEIVINKLRNYKI